MTAGLVFYKLCDREYDCDNCPLDAALKGVDIETPVAHARPEQTPRWEFRDDRRYHPSHGWVQETDTPGGVEIRYGLDVFAGRLLSDATAVVLPPVRSRVSAGHPACWVMDQIELIPLPSPVSGTVVRVNADVQKAPTLISTSPYDDGWLLEVSCSSSSENLEGLVSSAEMQNKTMLQLRQFHQKGLEDLLGDAAVGRTAADGGEPLTDLRRILGADRYHRLIREFLG
jgi:glycine cleavage system H protein